MVACRAVGSACIKFPWGIMAGQSRSGPCRISHELTFELKGRKVSEVAAMLHHALWSMFADTAKVFSQKAADGKLIVEVRTDYPDNARVALVAAAIYSTLDLAA